MDKKQIEKELFLKILASDPTIKSYVGAINKHIEKNYYEIKKEYPAYVDINIEEV